MNKYKYTKITEELIKTHLKDILYSVQKANNKKIEIWCFGYEDENGNITCGFLEAFDKAMKEEAKKYLDNGI